MTKHKRVNYVDHNGEHCEIIIPIEVYNKISDHKHSIEITHHTAKLADRVIQNATVVIIMLAVIAAIVYIST